MNSKVIAAIVAAVVLIGGGVYWVKHNNDKNSSSSSSSYSNPYGSSSPSPSPSSSSTTAVNNSVVQTKTNSSVGEYLADPSGKTLYTYGLDTSGKSNCTGSCLTSWPAYGPSSTSASLPTNISTITRSDNHTQQYAYKGMPLYYFVSDTSAGQVTGNGIDSFNVAKP